MKKLLLAISIILSLNTNSYAYYNSELAQNLDNYVYSEKGLKNSNIGIKLRDLKNNTDIYSVNSDKLFVPASNTKVLTTLLALEKLGKDYTFKTNLSYDGNISKNTLKGNVYLKFSGDPTFKHSDIDKLFDSLKSLDVKSINGDIVIDNSIFDNINYGQGWMWDDFESCDSSPIGAIYIDDNCFKAKIISQDGEIKLKTNNQVNFYPQNITVSEKDNLDISFLNNTLRVSGEIKEDSEIEIEKAIVNPELYLKEYLEKFLGENYKFRGKIIIGKLAKDTREIAVKESIKLLEILKRFDKESHNLTGELIIKTIASKEILPASSKKGMEILKKYLEQTFKYNDFKIVDGSGLSRYNLFSPSLMIDVLSYIYNKPEFKDIVFDSFSQGGKDGTLKSRFKLLKNYKVIAKSGSMTGINCLSGYLVNDKNAYAFSIMINNSNLSSQELRNIQDKIIYMIQ